MAKIAGFKCDGPKCIVTAEGGNVPVGWMILGVRAVVAGRAENETHTREDFHLCSNKCLKMLAIERHRAAIEDGSEEGSYYQRRKAAGA